jgi:hypothetical protein
MSGVGGFSSATPAANAGSAGTIEETGHKDKRVIRSERIGFIIDHVVEVTCGQTGAANEIACILFVQGLIGERSPRKISD